jgi:hypothetical protein
LIIASATGDRIYTKPIGTIFKITPIQTTMIVGNTGANHAAGALGCLFLCASVVADAA